MPEHERHQATERSDQPEAPGPLDAAFAPQAALILGAQRAYGNAVVARALAQRQAADGAVGGPAAPAAGQGGLIVADDTEPATGQLTRTAFLDRLRAQAADAVRDALGGSPIALAVGPGVDRWMAPYMERDAASLEQAIRAKLPAAGTATDAAALIAVVCAAVRSAVAGGVTDLPAEGQVAPEDSAALLAETEPPEIPSELLAQVTDVAAVLLKRRPDAAPRPSDARSVLRRLGAGRPLDDAARTRMEPLLGRDLDDVRVHVGGEGGRISDELGARAFAVGADVAFAPGEYAPGTPVGDALLAHELAHVGQQDAGAPRASDEPALERDADASAAEAVAALWHGDAGRSVQRRPRLRDGLALRRCGGGTATKPKRVKEPIPRDPRKIYEQKLPEGVTKLKVGFGRADVNARYDRTYWDLENDEITGESYLVLNKGKLPSDAIDAMFADLGKWSLDCAQFVQIAHLYALRWAYGNDEFDRRVGGVNFKFRPHYSDGLDKSVYWNREGPQQRMTRYRNFRPDDKPPEDRSPEKILADAPVGARVMWTNIDAPATSAFRNENTIKLGEGTFAAHGFGRPGPFAPAEIAQELANRSYKGGGPAPPDYVKANVYLKQVEIYEAISSLPAAPP